MRWLAAALLLVLHATTASAQERRFALIIGNDLGHADDARLAYAETDARKVHTVLRELGGFEPADMYLLEGTDARSVRQTLVALNDRIRNVPEGPRQKTLLFVYYSGHADDRALRLGGTRMELKELSQLVRGSSATFRLMVVDACRSSGTRRKGGRIVPPFELPSRGSSPGEGVAFLWASARNEDAQESDALRGSFYTHALVSGLLGAADLDGDGAVSLEEAYRYAYETTLRATSRSAQGVQHPSFDYDYRGHGALVLTRPGAATEFRGTLALPPDIGFLVLREDADGAVVAEVSAKDPARTLSLRSDTYYLRGRAASALFEGKVDLAAGETLDVDTDRLNRVQYARLVRKGESGPTRMHALDVGPLVRGNVPTSHAACWGALVGYSLTLERLTLATRFAVCRTQWHNDLVRATTQAYDMSLAGLHTWDLRRASLATGVAVGATIDHQRFETAGSAPNRTSTSPYLGWVADVTVDLTGPMFVRANVRVAAQLVRAQTDAFEEPALDVSLTLQGALLVGAYLGSGRP